MIPRLTATALGPARPRRPLLVLCASLGTSVEALWGPCAALLDGVEVVGVDLPGHGAAPAATGPFTVADLAAGVVAAVEPVLAARGTPGAPFDVAGDSLGGAVGLALLVHHPERLGRVTLACTGARIGTPEGWHERAALVRRDGLAPLVDSAPARWFGPGFADGQPERAAAVLRSLAGTDPASYAWACEALAGFDVRDRLATLPRAVLAVAGAHDLVTPVDDLRLLADTVPGGRLVVLPGVGHLAPLEAPEAVADLLTGDARTAAQARADGLAVRRAVLGDAHVDRAAGDDLTSDFQQFITEYAWGTIWTRPGLDRRARSMITLTALVAGGHHDELVLHLRAARRNGLTVAEIREVLLQAAVYCGVPAANTAFRIARDVLAEDAPG